MHVVLVAGELQTGGLERQLSYLAKGLTAEGHRTEVVAWNHEPNARFAVDLTEAGIPTIPLRGSPSAKLHALRELVIDGSPDVLHSYSFYLNPAIAIAARGSPTAAVGSLRSDYLAQVGRLRALHGLASSHWPRTVVVNSKNGARQLSEVRGRGSRRGIHFIPNAVDLDRFSYAEEHDAASRVRVLGIGSLTRNKRWDRAIDLAGRVSDMGIGVEFVIAGSGRELPALSERIGAFGLEEVCFLVGEIAQPEELLKTASILLHTSDSEGMPNVVLEAMAIGRPVLAADSGDIAYLLDNGACGLTFPRADLELAASHLSRLASDSALRRQLGRNGRNRVEREFTPTQLVDRTLAVYECASRG